MEKAQWRDRLNADSLPWLLEPDNPSVRYFALTSLLELAEDAPEVQEAKAAILEFELVRKIFAGQHPDGYWEEEDKPQWPTKTLEALSLLMNLGVERDERIERGCERILRHNQYGSGGFTYTGARSGVFNCLTGNVAEFLIYFGYGDDPRIERCVQFMVETLSQEDGLRCSRSGGLPCQWGAIGALRGFARLPARLQNEAVQEVIAQVADALLDYPFDFAGAEKRWLKFTVPPAYDLVEALSVLARHGYSGDPRFVALAKVLLEQQSVEGKWLKGAGGLTFPIDMRGKPSKLITLNALRVVKHMG